MVRHRPAIAAAGLLVAVVVACSPANTSPAQSATAGPTAPSVPASPTATAIARRSPAPLQPVRPSDLVVRIDTLGETCCPAPAVVATVDGRLITRADDGTLVERRLTAGGARQLADEVIGTGLFDRDRIVGLDPAPGVAPAPHAISVRTFRVWTGARTVTVSSPVVAQSDEKLYRPSAAWTQLDALAARLLAPESWLPVTAWSVATSRPYVPDGFRVVVSTEQVGGSQPDVSAVDWPFTIPIADLGEPLSASSQIFTPVGPGTKPLRCAALDASDAKAARDAIQRAGAGVADFPDGAFSTGLMWKAGGSGIVLFFQAVLPDQSSCADPY